MIIPVLTELENREQWLVFLRRERPYAQVKTPSCRVDLQSTYLQLTLFDTQHHSPLRYTLGSRTSLEPVWQLISGTGWSLSEIVNGLQAMDFSGNVRDRQLTDWSPDLSVRRSFPREPGLFNETSLGAFTRRTQTRPPTLIPDLINALAWGEFQAENGVLTNATLIEALITEPEHWVIEPINDDQLRLNNPPYDLTLSRVSFT